MAEGPAPAEPTLAGYRLLRRIASGERAEVFLASVDRTTDAAPDEPAPLVVVRVYDTAAAGEAIAVEVEAMSTDASGSLPELFDIATFDDGRCVLAVERLTGPSVARIIAERTLTPGEAVTILAPIVVAVAELARSGFAHTRLSPGDVLLDGQGRPRLVGLGGLQRLPTTVHARTPLLRAGHVALADLIDDVLAATRPAEPLAPVAELLHDRLATRPFTPCEAELERALFAAAAPTAVGGITVTARRSALPTRMSPPLDDASGVGVSGDDPEVSAPSRERRNGMQTLLALAQWPAFLACARASIPATSAERPAAGVRSRLQSAVRRRRPTLIVGGLVGGGVLVLLLTLVPPATARVEPAAGSTGAILTEAEAPAEQPSVEASVVAGPDGADAADGANAADGGDAAVPSGATSSEEIVAAVAALLARRAECFESLDLECLSEVLQPGSASESDDVAAMATARDGGESMPAFDTTRVAVTAQMGAAALVSVPYAAGEREPASLLVMRGETGWRLREIFD
ncbi:hypothetical protein [Agromyces badenianii]|uniref:hypothetical protein n=1 Tax=Agromyces badenianii TaxID=2080742 RepID=UPI0011B24312|nr:hypothetical protein [Agromyces badenianii]